MDITKQYTTLLHDIRNWGNYAGQYGNGRNGVFYSVFGRMFEINFNNTFKMIKARNLNLELIVKELKWFLSGSTDIPDYLQKIWRPFASGKDDNQIYSYGFAIRTNGSDEDQWVNAIYELVNVKDSRQVVINLWQSWYNPKPCHLSICLSKRRNSLYMSVMQRSADVLLGLPWDITQYSILLFLIAKSLNLRAEKLNWFIHDAHLYANQLDIAYNIEQITKQTLVSENFTSNQKMSFIKYPETIEDLSNVPFLFDVEFPNYNPICNVKVPYNV